MTDCSQFTLYSGGVRGAESEFGRNAECWGVKEVNFSFEGHLRERDKSIKMLTEEELSHGDISMDIVSKRMGRTYSEAKKIRNLLAPLNRDTIPFV